MRPLPDEYALLVRWFPTARTRAAAIGVTREMIRRWELALDGDSRPRVRAATARAIKLLTEVAAEVERLVGDPEGTGRWLLAPQPALRGLSVAPLLGERPLAMVAPLIAPPPEGATPGFSSARVRSAAAALGPAPRTPRERPRDQVEAAILRRLGDDELMIGTG